MRRPWAVAGTGLFFLVAPGTVAGYVPWLITRWHIELTGGWSTPLKVLGALLLLSGVGALIDSFVRFAIKGLGTPAPPLPTSHLVVSGFYRYVRNPMYVAVAAAIFGQALLFGNVTLLAYGALVCLSFHLFVIAYEEPSLRGRFGTEYENFCAAVPRWIPRLSPWQSDKVSQKPPE
jgi:protein-S-isoprenylcysteine O-methyltransferase Ste14